MERIELIVDAHSKCGVKRQTNQDCMGVNNWVSNQEATNQFADSGLLGREKQLQRLGILEFQILTPIS